MEGQCTRFRQGDRKEGRRKSVHAISCDPEDNSRWKEQGASPMTPSEIARVEDYLRRTFENPKIAVDVPKKKGHPIEMRVGDEFVGVVHRDEDEGEVSYSLNLVILEEDLPPAK